MREIKINKGILIIAVFIALIGCFFIGKVVSGIQHRAITESALNELRLAYNDTIVSYKIKLSGLEYDVVQKEQLILSKNQALSAEILKREHYRKLYLSTIEHNTIINGQVSVLLDSIAKLDSLVLNSSDVYFITEEDSTPCVRLPYDWVYSDSWLTAVGHVNEQAETSLKLDMAVELDVVLGTKIGGAPTVSILENNPHFEITGIKSIKVEDKRWYDSPWVKFGFGAVVGGTLVLLVR